MAHSAHCGSSQLYRNERIASHSVQFRATILVLKYFALKYSYPTLHRHTEKIGAALGRLEITLHKEQDDADD